MELAGEVQGLLRLPGLQTNLPQGEAVVGISGLPRHGLPGQLQGPGLVPSLHRLLSQPH